MEFLRAEGDYTQLGDAWARYRSYLESIRGQIPPEAYDFATAPWHYDPADHRSLHDAWVEEVTLREDLASEGEASRRLSLGIRLLGPYHDGHTYLSYAYVSGYQLVLPRDSSSVGALSRPSGGHNDWLIDELRLSSSGTLLHEVVFSSGARWLIESEFIKHSTDIPERRG
jgi:hypothetical protein